MDYMDGLLWMDFGYRDIKEQWFDMADEHYGKKVDDVAVKDC